MRVSVLLSDSGACGTYRMIWPAQSVKRVRQDWDIQLHPPGQVGFYVDKTNGNLKDVVGLAPFEELDLLVVHRVGSMPVVQLMQRAQQAGCAVLLDNDDAMWAIDRQNMAWHAWNNNRPGTGHHWKLTDVAAKQADLCSVTTEVLARRYGNGRSVIVPNYVPEHALDCAIPSYDVERTPVVGWFGHLATHPKDPGVVGDAVRYAVRDTGCEVAVQPDAEAVGLIWSVPEIKRVLPAQLGDAYFTSLRELDIALVPLELSTFNRAKSGLKALEFATAGAAVVATPTPANVALARDLPILMARTPAEWHEHIVRLVNDPTERRERGEQSRAIVREKWTFESNAEQWAAVWERAYNRRSRLKVG